MISVNDRRQEEEAHQRWQQAEQADQKAHTTLGRAKGAVEMQSSSESEERRRSVALPQSTRNKFKNLRDEVAQQSSRLEQQEK